MSSFSIAACYTLVYPSVLSSLIEMPRNSLPLRDPSCIASPTYWRKLSSIEPTMRWPTGRLCKYLQYQFHQPHAFSTITYPTYTEKIRALTGLCLVTGYSVSACFRPQRYRLSWSIMPIFFVNTSFHISHQWREKYWGVSPCLLPDTRLVCRRVWPYTPSSGEHKWHI